jgi:1-acyl-sn-glycerol-3-phosphate acyltransferase
MIRALIISMYYALYVPVAAIVGFPSLFLTGRIDFLWKIALAGAQFGAWMVGVRWEAIGCERLDPNQTYIFMANHQSNIDPPVLVPLIGRRVFILVKKELFRIPILGYAMRRARFIAVDRANREAAVESVRQAIDVLNSGLSLMVYPEGTRSRDGRLLPFKKGPFHLAMDSGVPVVPVTIVGAHEVWPKGEFRLTPGLIRVIFHPAVDPHAFASREELMEAVRATIEDGLPEQQRATSVPH